MMSEEWDALLNFEPVEKFKNWSDMSELGVLETVRAEEFNVIFNVI